MKLVAQQPIAVSGSQCKVDTDGNQWLQRPPVLPVHNLRGCRVRPYRPVIDPAPQHRDSHRRKPSRVRLSRRHHHIFIQPRHVFNERTLRTFPRHNIRCRTLSAVQRQMLHIHAILAFRLLRAMTCQAMLRKNRLHIPDKIHRRPRRRRQLRSRRRGGKKEIHRAKHTRRDNRAPHIPVAPRIRAWLKCSPKGKHVSADLQLRKNDGSLVSASATLADGVKAAQVTLTHLVKVRILVGQLFRFLHARHTFW